jgi:general secretion pathway protein I
MRTQSEEAGFTLLEVLVAFVIAALALGVLFEGAVSGLRSTRVADRTEEALSRARSHLATIGHGVALRTTTQEGEDGSLYHWRIAVVPLQSAPSGASGGQAAPKLVLYGVTVEESWPDGEATRRVTLRTQRLGLEAVGR